MRGTSADKAFQKPSSASALLPLGLRLNRLLLGRGHRLRLSVEESGSDEVTMLRLSSASRWAATLVRAADDAAAAAATLAVEAVTDFCFCSSLSLCLFLSVFLPVSVGLIFT